MHVKTCLTRSIRIMCSLHRGGFYSSLTPGEPGEGGQERREVEGRREGDKRRGEEKRGGEESIGEEIRGD